MFIIWIIISFCLIFYILEWFFALCILMLPLICWSSFDFIKNMTAHSRVQCNHRKLRPWKWTWMWLLMSHLISLERLLKNVKFETWHFYASCLDQVLIILSSVAIVMRFVSWRIECSCFMRIAIIFLFFGNYSVAFTLCAFLGCYCFLLAAVPSKRVLQLDFLH